MKAILSYAMNVKRELILNLHTDTDKAAPVAGIIRFMRGGVVRHAIRQG